MVRHHPLKGISLSILTGHFMNIRSIMWRSLPKQPCLLCGSASRDGVWCAACDANLPYLTMPHCPVCALPTHNGAICGHCLQHAPNFDRTVAVYAYAFPLNKLVQALKHGQQLVLVNSLADKLAQQVKVRPDCIVAMPLHPARLRERSFNQSLELARRVSRQMNIPLLLNACQRVRDTPPQTTLSRTERSKNMRLAFACSQDLKDRHVAVVDDVMTSGASLNEVARALRVAGAREVSAWVIARTLPHSTLQQKRQHPS